jgi:hypothetical protein
VFFFKKKEERERINRLTSCVFLRKEKSEREKKKKGHGTALASPLKQILVILALVVYKILEKTLIL